MVRYPYPCYWQGGLLAKRSTVSVLPFATRGSKMYIYHMQEFVCYILWTTSSDPVTAREPSFSVFNVRALSPPTYADSSLCKVNPIRALARGPVLDFVVNHTLKRNTLTIANT